MGDFGSQQHVPVGGQVFVFWLVLARCASLIVLKKAVTSALISAAALSRTAGSPTSAFRFDRLLSEMRSASRGNDAVVAASAYVEKVRDKSRPGSDHPSRVGAFPLRRSRRPLGMVR